MSTMMALATAAALTAVAKDEVTSLPGWAGALPSKQYSGYLSFGPSSRKHIHYYYVESTGKNPADPKTPTVLWMNGGPGCSSLDGWYYEHGPFRNEKGNATKLVANPASWAKVANMIYIEAPVGVGFSYSDLPSVDYKQNDDISSQDNLHAVETFFRSYPELKSHPFYIAGESYGGVYVPTLAEAVLWAVGNGTYTGAKLDGIAVGNGCTGNAIGSCGTQRDQFDTELFLHSSFISNKQKADITAACDWKAPSATCRALIKQMHEGLGNIDLYNIYGECINSINPTEIKRTAPLGETEFYGAELGGPDACLDSRHASDYFNQPSVIAAMHVKPINFTWATCATAKGWTYDSNRANLPRDTYPLLVKNLKVLIYNGDWDACVPYTDNIAWTSGMGYEEAAPWHVWSYKSVDDGSEQVGGYATRYANNDFTFITIRGGRHEVPETAPVKVRLRLLLCF